jgi:hypothetical protein
LALLFQLFLGEGIVLLNGPGHLLHRLGQARVEGELHGRRARRAVYDARGLERRQRGRISSLLQRKGERALSPALAVKFNISPGRWQHFPLWPLFGVTEDGITENAITLFFWQNRKMA